jgi:carboxylesterase
MIPWTLAATLTIALFITAVLGIRTRRRVMQRFEHLVESRHPMGADGIVIGAAAIRLDASPSHAVLLLHGFGDTPQSVAPLAHALHAAGWSVLAPLLPGHGRSLSQYAAAREADWVGAAEQAYSELQAQYDTVVLCGISMGAALATISAQAHPDIPAIALLAPYFVTPRGVQLKIALATMFSAILPYHANAGSDRSIHDAEARVRSLGTGVVTATSLAQLRLVATRARAALPALRSRVLYLQSREDNRITIHDAEEQFARIGSATKVQRWLTGCGHIVTVDYCKDEVARQVIEWFAPALASNTSSGN